MIGILIILICWCLGNLLSLLTGGYVSGNVIGMLLLYAALHFRVVKAEKVAPTAKLLSIGNEKGVPKLIVRHSHLDLSTIHYSSITTRKPTLLAGCHAKYDVREYAVEFFGL